MLVLGTQAWESALVSWDDPASEELTPLPCRVAQAVTLPLATVSVKEARQLNLCYAFEVISPVQTLTLQAATQEEMELWISTIQNATASLLGCTQRTRMSMKDMEDTVLGRVRPREPRDGLRAQQQCR